MKKLCLLIWLVFLLGCGAQTNKQPLLQEPEADWTAVIQKINTLPEGYETCRPELREDPPLPAWPAEKIDAHIHALKTQGETLSADNENSLRQQLNRLNQPPWTEYSLESSNCGFKLDEIDKIAYYATHYYDAVSRPFETYFNQIVNTDLLGPSYSHLEPSIHPVFAQLFVSLPDLQLWWEVQAEAVYVYADLELKNKQLYRSDTLKQLLPEQHRQTISHYAYKRAFRPECPQDKPLESCPYQPVYANDVNDTCAPPGMCISDVDASPPHMRSVYDFRQDPKYRQCFQPNTCAISIDSRLILISELHKHPEYQNITEFKVRTSVYGIESNTPVTIGYSLLPDYFKEALRNPPESSPESENLLENLFKRHDSSKAQ